MSRQQSTAGRVPRGWSFSQWPLRRKLAAAVAVPVLLAFFFGGLRVKNDFDTAQQLSNAAETVRVIRPVVDYNLAIQHLAAAESVGGGGVISAITRYESAAADLRIAIKAPGVPASVKKNAESALSLGQSVRSAKTQSAFSDTVIDKSGQTASLMSTAVSDLGLTNDSASAKIVLALQDAIAAQRALTGQQVNLANTDDAANNLRAIGQVGAETAALTRLQSALGAAQAGAVRQLLNENGRRGYTLQQAAPTKAEIDGLGPVIESSNTAYSALLDGQLSALDANLRQRAADYRQSAIVNAAIIALALALALALVLGLMRSLLGPIRAVRQGALEVANKRLPEAVSAMRDGEEPPAFTPIPVHTREEMGQLARAVDDLHNQALTLAGEQARLRVQVGHMFETLSRRSTSLIDQQLTLIERLESDEEDPKRLQSLFRLDHLAARMRRNSDSLLVLAGTSTRRGVSGAVSVSDAVRAAVSEVENYERIDIGDTSNDLVLGAVGSDLIHLIAEVVDNALAYSPPTTRVAIRGARTPEGGLLVEVTDKGLGMPPKELAALNDRLAHGGDVTADTARRMGLFVAGSLAKRHGIAVRLRRNGDDKQGITVSIHLPAGLLADSARAERPARPAPATGTAGPAAPAAFTTPPTSAVGGTTKAGLPTRVRGASGATPTPSPVPGAAKKLLPTRTPGAHGPTASNGIPAAVRPVIDGADGKPGDDKPAVNGKAAADAETEHNAKDHANGKAPETPEQTPAAQAAVPAATAADQADPEAHTAGAAEPSGPTLSPAGLPVRKPRATGITEYRDREFQDAPSAPEETRATDTTAAKSDAPAKGNRLTSWLPGRAKAAAEAARLEAEANEPRQMPSNLSAWLDHRAKLVEATRARELGEDVQATTADDADTAQDTTTDLHVPDEWVAEATVSDAAPVDGSSPAPGDTVAVTGETGTDAEPSDSSTAGTSHGESTTADLPVDGDVVDSVDSAVSDPAAEVETTEPVMSEAGLPTRRPGATTAAREEASASPVTTAGRPALRAHNTSFFGARRAREVATVTEAAPEGQTEPATDVVERAETVAVVEPPAVEPAETVAVVEPPAVELDGDVQVDEGHPVAERDGGEVAQPLNDTPIFRAMMSRWLTDETVTTGEAESWSSTEADQAWSAAARIEESEPLEESAAGLPKRRPGNQLVPGALDRAEDQTTAPAPSRRDPEAIRRSLNRHKDGVSSARTDTQDGNHREEADVHH